MTKISTKLASNGIQISFKGRDYGLYYPENLWKEYPYKNIFVKNYISLATLPLPILLNLKMVHYNSPKPDFQSEYKKLMLKDLLSSADDDKQDATKLAQRFLNVKYEFEKESRTETITEESSDERAVVSLSYGKDSLLSLAAAKELGLDPVTVYINDTVSPAENKLKIILGKKLSAELGQKHYIITNSVEQLNDFETWNKPETCFNYSHMVTGFCFIALPLIYRHRAKYIIIGNEQDMDFSFKNKQGIEAWPSYDQTTEWQREQNKMIKKMASKNTEVVSLIRPLTNITTMMILHRRYPDIAKYQASCDGLDVSDEKRWCCNCNMCASSFIFIKAFGANERKAGLKNMLEKKHRQLYILFDGKEVDRYQKNPEAKEQQLLSFLLAYRNGAKGYLMDLFKKKFLAEALEKEEFLRKKYFRLWPAEMPGKLKPVLGIYKEELKDFA